jgi:TrmH family RNA methyltransferase
MPLVVAEGIQDPGNLGAIARVTEAAAGAALLRSSSSASWRHPRALRASAGSLFRLVVYTYEDLAATFEALGLTPADGWALLPSARLSCWDDNVPAPRWIVLGSEGSGLSPQVADLAGSQVSIPMASPVESLNVATSAAIVLFELRRRARVGS